MSNVIKLGSRPGAKYLIVRVPEQVPMRDEDGHMLTYDDSDTITVQQLVVDDEGFPILDEDGNEVLEDVEVPAPFGEVKTETRYRAYRVPLASLMTMVDLDSFYAAADANDSGDNRAMLRYFRVYFARYMPKRVVDSLTQEDMDTLITEWVNANNAEGLSQGE